MAKKKDMTNAFMTMAPMWGWPGDPEEQKEQWKGFKDTIETYWKQMEAIQTAVVETQKELWNRVFPRLMEMQDTFAASLPTAPGMPEGATPKAQAEKLKEFQEMANKHVMEQADSAIEFAKQGQEKAKEAVKETVESVEETLDKNQKA